MLSRVADSLYWMSRYFERADHCARVLEANYALMLDPSKLSTEQRWQRITTSLGLSGDSHGINPQTAMLRLTSESTNRSSLVSCIGSARENASQVREQISSEMWESLNALYHDVTVSAARNEKQYEPMRLASAVREGSFRFHGITDGTMNHGEGWHFIQLGKYIERAASLSRLLDTHFTHAHNSDDLEWVGLLSSCAAFEAYCRVYTADLKADRVAEFLILNHEFPYSIRFAAERMNKALEALTEMSSARKVIRIDRTIGSLRSSLAYKPIEEIMSGNIHDYLNSIQDQCRRLHDAVQEVYIDYPIESAFQA